MNELVIMKNQQAVTSSLKVAEIFGKNHQHVLRDIDSLISKSEGVSNSGQTLIDLPMFFRSMYVHPQNGQKYPVVYMNRDGFTLLAMGFTGSKALEFKLKYIEAFNSMEATIKGHHISLPQTPMEALKLMFDATKDVDKKVDKVTHRVTDLENNQTIAPGEYGYISHQVTKAVNEYVSMHPFIHTQQQRGKLFKDISRGLNEVTGVKTRTQLRRKDFDTADEFIANWQPSTATVQIIKQLSGEAAGQTSMEV